MRILLGAIALGLLAAGCAHDDTPPAASVQTPVQRTPGKTGMNGATAMSAPPDVKPGDFSGGKK